MASSKGPVRIVWEGVDEFQRYLKETPGLVVKDVKAAMTQEGEDIMGVSKRRTPVDTDTLRSSGHVKPAAESQGNVIVELAYGTDYAIYVHEILHYSHPSGQAKFLESAVKEAAKGFGGRLMDRIEWRRGGL